MADRAVVPDVETRPPGRPIYHHQRESIEAHLSIVFTALAVTRHIEAVTGWSIRKVRAHRPLLPHHYHPDRHHTITAADPLPDDLAAALKIIHSGPGGLAG